MRSFVSYLIINYCWWFANIGMPTAGNAEVCWRSPRHAEQETSTEQCWATDKPLQVPKRASPRRDISPGYSTWSCLPTKCGMETEKALNRRAQTHFFIIWKVNIFHVRLLWCFWACFTKEYSWKSDSVSEMDYFVLVDSLWAPQILSMKNNPMEEDLLHRQTSVSVS